MRLYGLIAEQRILTGLIATLTAVQFLAAAAVPGARWLPLLRFSVLLLCALLVMASYWNTANAADWSLLMLAMLLTVTADALLTLAGLQLFGIVFFIGVQLVYIRRFARWLFRYAAMAVATVAALSAVAMLVLKLSLPVLWIAAGVYACLLLLAVVTSFAAALPLPNRRLSQLGMVLFALCDIHVALTRILPAGVAYRQVSFTMIWLFYLPAQCLLALSATAFSPVPVWMK